MPTPFSFQRISGLLLLLLSSQLLGEMRFRNYSIRDGLSQSTILALCEDRQGFLWLATQDGLNRFDGYEFKIYRHDPDNENSLSDNSIQDIYEDHRGYIWIGCGTGGLNRFDPKTETFLRFDVRKFHEDIGQNGVFTIMEVKKQLWIGVAGGFVKFDVDNFAASKFYPVRSKGRVLSIEGRHDDFLWVGHRNGLSLINPETGEVREIDLGVEDTRVRGLHWDKGGVLWIGSDSGLHRLGPGEKKAESIQLGAAVWNIYEDRQDNIWAPSISGLIRYQRGAQGVEIYRQEPGNLSSLLGNLALCATETSDGLLWIGTTSGLNVYDYNTQRFQITHSKSNLKDGLMGSDVWSFYQKPDEADLIWVGTSRGLNLVNLSNGMVQFFQRTENDLVKSRAVTSLMGDPSDKRKLWTGTVQGLELFDMESKTYLVPDLESLPWLKTENVITIHTDIRGRIWFGTDDGLVERTSTGFVHYQHDRNNEQSLSHNSVMSMNNGPSGYLWLGTMSGLNLFDLQQKTVKRYPKSLAENGTSHGTIWDIHLSGNGTLWVGTSGGLNRYHPDTDRFTAIRERDGLPNEYIYGILEDELGKLWLGTGKGLVSYDPDTKITRSYDMRDGLNSNEFNHGASYRSLSGQLHIGGVDGFTSFYPNTLGIDHYKPPVVITKLRVNNQDVMLRDRDPESPLTQAINYTKALQVSHKQNSLSFEFAGLNFAQPDSNQYAFMLEGFDEDWVPTSPQKRSATYTNLDPADYTFKVKASNHDGVWNEVPASIQIKIHPSPWLRWWAKLLYFIIGALFILRYLNNQQRELRRQRELAEKDRLLAQKERETAAQLRELDKLKDEFLANTSHELRTPLNGIIGIAESLVDGVSGQVSDSTKHNLHTIIAAGRRLSHLVDDLLDFSKLKHKNLVIQQRPVDIHAVVNVVLSLSKPLLAGKPVTLVNHIPKTVPAVLGDENRLFQIMHNLVGNSVKFTKEGKVEISATLEAQTIAITVTDTGIGIPQEQQAHIFEPYQQVSDSYSRGYGGTGLGLTVTKNLVELHKGSISFESQEGEGTRFTICLPITEEKAPAFDRTETLSLAVGEEPLLPQWTSDEERKQFDILVVDDEAINRQVLRNHLLACGYGVTEAIHGQEALALLEARSFDLVLLDIMMPELSGIEVCRHIRLSKSMEELPIIFLTALKQTKDLSEAFHSGANDYLTKPISKIELLSRVQTHLRLLDNMRHLETKVEARTQAISRYNQDLETLDAIVRTINLEIEKGDVFDSLLTQGAQLFPAAEKGIFLLADDPDANFKIVASFGYGKEIIGKEFLNREDAQRRYMGLARKFGEHIYINANCHELPEIEGHVLETPESMLAMTLGRTHMNAILVWDNYQSKDAFDEEDAQRLERFREHAFAAVNKALFMNMLKDKNQVLLRTQNQLIMQEKMASMGILASGVAHELRNPLNFISNFATIADDLVAELKESLGSDKTEDVDEICRELLENTACIRQHSSRACRIVEGMVTFTGMDSSEYLMTNLNPLIKKFASITRTAAQSHEDALEISLEFDLDPNVAPVPISIKNFSRAMVNFIRNSSDAIIEAMQQGCCEKGRITIASREMGDGVRIIIDDNGIGIPQDVLSDIYTPFFTQKPESVGLGLSICYEVIVKEHAGKIEVDTEEGKYTRFTIELPRT